MPPLHTESSRLRTYKLPGYFADGMSGLAQAWCLLCFGLGVWTSVTGFAANQYAVWATGLAIIIAAVWCCLPLRIRIGTESTWSHAGIALLVLLSAASWYWALRYDSNQVSDFGLYYRCGMRIHAALPDWIAQCRSHFFYQPDNTYWVRAVAYSAPLGRLWGDSYTGLKLYNALLHTLTMAILYFGLRALKGPRAALIALLLFGMYPEWFYAITISTPDNLALLCVVCFLLMLPALGHMRYSTAMAAGLALIIFVAHLSRTIGPFLIATACLWTCAWGWRLYGKRAVLHLLVILLVYYALSMMFASVVNAPAQAQFQLLPRISTIDLAEPLQNFRLVFGWIDQFLPIVPDADKGQVIFKKIALEFSQGFSNYPTYIMVKAKVLFEGTGYYFFSTSPFDTNPDSAQTAAATTVPSFRFMPMLLGAMVTFQLSLSTLSLVMGRRDPLITACLFFAGFFFVAILGLGDTQQRYSLLIAPVLAIATAVCAFPSPNDSTGRQSGAALPPRSIGWVAAGMVMLVLFFSLGVKAAQHVAAATPKPLLAVSQLSPPASSGSCKTGTVRFDATYKRLRVLPPTDISCFSFAMPLPAQARSVSFFVSRDAFPFPFEPRAVSPYHYQVMQNGAVLFDGELGNEVVQWHKLDTASHKAGYSAPLVFNVRTTGKGGSGEPFNVWLVTPGSRPAHQ